MREGAFEARPRRNTSDFLETFQSSGQRPPALARIPGFDIQMLRIDFMRTDHLGCAHWLAGNALVQIASVIARAPG
eukprot:4644341-Alexandrium_andersonii.AAC.1